MLTLTSDDRLADCCYAPEFRGNLGLSPVKTFR
jgi:hypothetical protein